MNASDAPPPREAVDLLAASTAPLLLGVRHHSPALASIVARTLDAFEPTTVLVELPAELQAWLPWVGAAGASTPLALAATVRGDEGSLAFYPLADFSPELVAIRWATSRGVKVEAFDLPVAERTRERRAGSADGAPGLLDALLSREGADGFEELWDRMVEARAERQPAEAIRRAALALGWALRLDAILRGRIDAHDLRREGYMRARLAEALRGSGARVAAVVGAFHASALVDPPLLAEIPPFAPRAVDRAVAVATALLPYSFPLLDSRSGYPAGIRDPAWQQRVVDALVAERPIEGQAFEVITAVARSVRASRHVASFPDAREAARFAVDLARIRGLTSPSRRELLEGIEAALGQGEPIGRGRVLARALSKVLVGDRRGVLAAGTPRSGLGPHVDDLFRELGLPGPAASSGGVAAEAKELVLDPLRSALDRRREVTLERLEAASISYATRQVRGRTAASIDALSTKWSCRWTPTTDATVELAGLFGITLADAARGRLLEARARAEAHDQRPATIETATLWSAARSGLGDLVIESLERLLATGLPEATFAEVVAASDRVARLRAGHVPGLPLDPADAVPEAPAFTAELSGADAAIAEAVVRAFDGLAGSSSLDDARALRDLLDLPERAGLGGARLGRAVDDLAARGSPLMQGAGTALAFLLERLDAEALAPRVTSFLHDGDGAERAARIRGLLVVGMPALEAEPAFVRALVAIVAALPDAGFLARLPSLRDGFEVLSPRARDRLLAVLVAAISPSHAGASAAELDADPVQLAALAEADLAAAAALAALGLSLDDVAVATDRVAAPEHPRATRDELVSAGAISTRDRLRLVLGRERDALPAHARRAAVALDRLYGRGEGEGSNDLDAGDRSGSQFPSVRVWSEEILALFGERVREEVVGVAAERGEGEAALDLDPARARPSIELLEQILSLRGGLSEGDLTRLRALVARIVQALVAELATRVRPALAGLVSPRPTSRPGGPLDLRRTLHKNLRTARERDGVVSLVPERLVFRTRQKRSLDWHVVLVVDVSGSMEPSVIYSALMAAILSGMPALTVRFVAFNDRVVDLSDHAADPLALLLEIAIGGGTLVGNALRYARTLVRVPSRTLCLVVSDFEDGGPAGQLEAEVRALVESGVRLLGLAALDDRGAPRYERAIAEAVARAGMPVAALSPVEVAAWIGEQIRR